GDLLAVHHGLERRADRDLRLAVADVAAHQAVHRFRLFHVALHLLDRRQLIARLLVREGVLELALPRRVGAERVALHRHADAVQADELPRHLADGAAHTSLRARPVARAEAMQPRLLAAPVARD